jgi:hypothetical protein
MTDEWLVIGFVAMMLYFGGFGGMYWYFMSLLNTQLDFNDLILKRMMEIDNEKQDDINMVVSENTQEFNHKEVYEEE